MFYPLLPDARADLASGNPQVTVDTPFFGLAEGRL
jgi:hypothetical protein